MIRPININLNAAHPELPLVEATTFIGAPSSVFIHGVPKSCGNWRITSVSVAATYPDNTTTTRAAVESSEGVWVATIPATATSGRTASGFRILADGTDENGAAVSGYVLGLADFAVFSLLPVPAPGETFYYLRHFDTVPATPRTGDTCVIDGVLKWYNGTAWQPFGGDMSHSQFASLPSDNLDPEEVGLPEICNVINAMKNLLRPAVSAIALLCALAVPTVSSAASAETNKLVNLKGASNVVTAVSFDGLATTADATNIAEAVAASATNALDVSLSTRLSRESQNSTNYTDTAIAAATNDLASASSLTNYATRAELDAGWWSEWTVTPPDNPARPAPYSVSVDDTDVYIYDGNRNMIGGEVDYSDNLYEFNATDENTGQIYTATRHKVCAPVPTKPEDIGAASVADATLTPQFSEWTIPDYTNDGYGGKLMGVVWDGDNGCWGFWFEYDAYPIESATDPDTLSVSANLDGTTVTATRTVISYTLGSQSTKPLQPKGDYAQASVLADIAETATNALETAGAAAATSSTNSANIATLNAQVSSIGAYINAEDAHFVSTNYDSVVNLPEAYVEIKMRDESTGSNTWITIWQEMRRWTAFVGSAFDWQTWQGFHTWATNITHELSFKADRCWGIYDSETGGYSPEGYTQISSSNILIAAGMAYQRTVTSGGAVWILRCNQGVAQMGGDTNGFFQVFDGDGVVQFEIVKGDRREVGANADGITVDNSYSPALLTIPYSILADEHPTLQICDALETANWKAETDPDCLANVEWSGLSGAWVATVQRKTEGDKLFVKATYMEGGETYIRNAAPVSMDSIILNGVKYYLGTATISGHTVLTLSTTAP